MAMREAAIHGGNKAPDGATQIEVKVGPFKGFKGYLTNDKGDDGADAKLVIFGRETDVTLEAGEFVTL
jgi:transcription antitermination factor NusG